MISADKFYRMPTDKEILERIFQMDRQKGNFAVVVFEKKTKQFVALLEVETLDGTDFEEGAVEFLFPQNKIIKNVWGTKVKQYFNEICKNTWLFKRGCVEKVNLVDHYKLQEIPT